MKGLSAFGPGERVRIKAKSGAKARGRITHLRVENEPIGAPGEMVPGRTAVTLTIVVEWFDSSS